MWKTLLTCLVMGCNDVSGQNASLYSVPYRFQLVKTNSAQKEELNLNYFSNYNQSSQQILASTEYIWMICSVFAYLRTTYCVEVPTTPMTRSRGLDSLNKKNWWLFVSMGCFMITGLVSFTYLSYYLVLINILVA